jgi:hypothetical protein
VARISQNTINADAFVIDGSLSPALLNNVTFTENQSSQQWNGVVASTGSSTEIFGLRFESNSNFVVRISFVDYGGCCQ